MSLLNLQQRETDKEASF